MIKIYVVNYSYVHPSSVYEVSILQQNDGILESLSANKT